MSSTKEEANINNADGVEEKNEEMNVDTTTTTTDVEPMDSNNVATPPASSPSNNTNDNNNNVTTLKSIVRLETLLNVTVESIIRLETLLNSKQKKELIKASNNDSSVKELLLLVRNNNDNNNNNNSNSSNDMDSLGIILGQIIKSNTYVEEIYLSNGHLGIAGLKGLIDGLIHNHKIDFIDLSFNKFNNNNNTTNTTTNDGAVIEEETKTNQDEEKDNISNNDEEEQDNNVVENNNNNNNAFNLLHDLLQNNHSIQKIDISYCGLTKDETDLLSKTTNKNTNIRTTTTVLSEYYGL